MSPTLSWRVDFDIIFSTYRLSICGAEAAVAVAAASLLWQNSTQWPTSLWLPKISSNTTSNRSTDWVSSLNASPFSLRHRKRKVKEKQKWKRKENVYKCVRAVYLYRILAVSVWLCVFVCTSFSYFRLVLPSSSPSPLLLLLLLLICCSFVSFPCWNEKVFYSLTVCHVHRKKRCRWEVNDFMRL